MSIKIKDMQVKLYKVPLKENLIDSLHGLHTHFGLITVTLTDENGASGTGYTYTGGRGGFGISNLIDKDLRQYIVGKSFDEPSDLTYMLDRTMHYVGRGGILSFALSAVDIAAWDLKLKLEAKPLYSIYGKEYAPVKTYYGGIDLGYSKERLLQSIQEALDAGHDSAKIKIGKDDPAEDIDRIESVRKLLGDDSEFMIDANMVLTVEKALKMSNAVKDLNIKWFEEPLNPDDLMGYRTLSEQSPIPIAMGENLHTFYEQKHAIEIAKVKYIQPDASNILGISGWLRVAELAKEHNMTVNPHGMQELHVNLMAAIDNAGSAEFHSFPLCDYMVDEFKVHSGMLLPSKKNGIGVTFSSDKLDKYEVEI